MGRTKGSKNKNTLERERSVKKLKQDKPTEILDAKLDNLHTRFGLQHMLMKSVCKELVLTHKLALLSLVFGILALFLSVMAVLW